MNSFTIKNVFILFGLSLMLVASQVSAETINLRFSSAAPVMQTITGQIIAPWIDKINKAGEGKVKIKLYPAGALGKLKEQFDLVTGGIADLSYHIANVTPGRFPMTTVFSLPFMVPSGEKVSAAMWKTYQEEAKFREEYSEVKVLALFGHSGGHFYTANKPIRTMADFKGLKIRTSNPAVSEALKIWGAIPVSMPYTDVYQALERNILDGSVFIWEGMQVFKLKEVCKYCTVADLYTSPMMIVMNKDKWESLPSDIKKLIDGTTGLEMSMAAGAAYDKMEIPFRKMSLEQGMEEILLDPAEKMKLKQSTIRLREEWVKDYTAKGYPAQQILDTALRYINE